MKEATARIKINKLLEAAGWRFFPEGDAPANIRLEPSVTIKSADLDALGENFEKTKRGFVDFLLLDSKGFPLVVLEAKAEDKNPLVGKEQARKYARSQNCRFVILSSGNLHYFWDLERGNPYVITTFPTPDSVIGYQKVTPNPQRLIAEQVDDDYIVLTQRPTYQAEAGWRNEAERPGYIQANKLRFLRPYQLKAVHSLQAAVDAGKDRFLFEMATGTGKTLTAAAVIKLFLRSGSLPSDTRVSFVPMSDVNAHRMAFRPTEEKSLSEVTASYTYFEDNDVLLAKVTPCFENGKAGIARGLLNGIGFGSSEFYILRTSAQVLPEWVYFCVMHPMFRDAAIAQMTGTGGLQRVPRDYVENFRIPLPPLEAQKEIVAEIEGYQKVIDGAVTVLDNYRPHIPVQPDWPTSTIGEICTLSSGGTPSKANESYWIGDIPWVSGKDMKSYRIRDAEMHISKKAVEESATQIAPVGSLLILVRGMGLANGIPIAEVTAPCAFNQDIRAIHPPQTVYPAFLLFVLRSHLSQFEKVRNTAAHGTLKIDTDDLRNIRFPLPPLATQQSIVAEIEAEQALVDGNRELIARFEKKIEATLSRAWGENELALAEA